METDTRNIPQATDSGSVHSEKRSKFELISIMAGVMSAIFLAALDQTIVSTAMPRIIADLNGFEHYAWVFTAYMLTSTIVVPIIGKLSDIYGRKVTLLAGVAIFLAGSVVCGLAQSMVQLMLFRGFQGLGAGILMSGAFTAIGDLFPPAERGKWQGIVAAVFGLSSVVGPMLGGLITDNLSWRWVFYVNVPVGIMAASIIFFLFPMFRRPDPRPPIDFAGAATLTLGLVPILLGFVWAGNLYPWASAQILGLFGIGIAMLIAFALVEQRAKEPIIPLDLFRNPIFTIGASVVFLTAMAMFGGIVYLPLFVQGVIGTSATASGAVLTPMTFVLIFSNVIAGQLISRTGRYQRVAIVGLTFQILGLGLLATMNVDTDEWAAIRNMLVAGLGMGLTMPVFVIAVQNALPYSRLGVVTSSMQLGRSVGSTVGVAVLGSLVTGSFHDEFIREVPAAVKDILAPGVLDRLGNPQVLVNTDAQAQLMELLKSAGTQNGQAIDQVFHALRQALAISIHNAFLVGLAVIVLAWVLTLFLKEIPLRRSNRPLSSSPSASPAPSA